MRISKNKVFSVAVWIIVAVTAAYSQKAADPMRQLVETSAQRLAIAEQVALAKWDSGAPVEDPSREAQVIATATKAGEEKGLDGDAVSKFFRAQIEANKLVQYSLLAEWRRAGNAPSHKPVNLANTIRPELDRIETQLIEELTKTKMIRASSSCGTETAKEVGKYVSAHKDTFTQLEAIALDRAMSGACESATR
jgi:chorismate mutase